MDSVGHCHQQVVESWEAAAGVGRPGEVLNKEEHVLQVGEDLEHQVVEAEFTKEVQAVGRATDQEEELQGDHGQVEPEGGLGVFKQGLHHAVHDHEELDQEVG